MHAPKSIMLARKGETGGQRSVHFLSFLDFTPILRCGRLLFFPALEGFFVEVAAFEVAGDDAVAGAEEVGEEAEGE